MKDEGGGYQLDLPIAEHGARTGSWTVEAYIDPEGKPIADLSFLVEDVVPARIETEMTALGRHAGAGHRSHRSMWKAKFLYGAPAADLPVKADLTIAQGRRSLPGAARLSLRPRRRGCGADAAIRWTTAGPMRKAPRACRSRSAIFPDTAQPLAATLRVEVYEFGGRPVIKSQKLRSATGRFSIGIKPVFDGDDGAVGRGASISR